MAKKWKPKHYGQTSCSLGKLVIQESFITRNILEIRIGRNTEDNESVVAHIEKKELIRLLGQLDITLK
ncbi:hypothetical protein Sam46_gp60 [Bacillus phage vB_BcM_Sam46]|uniref:Uncharacterized protein n=2 Tax=Caudoviricetes TaxID=2731619 RepID=A0A6G9L890_9CAUD|nr:hypothetical protein Sam112_gp57 [Bacillus phage vB_BcM_Sam112]QIQ61261.1 hypothetical protein Sam46_gp60 [Bacillus phage vB_BcM_Sam46]